MIIRNNYSQEHIRELQALSKKDPALIERVLHAFGLLEAITGVGMPFIFKGGTCLMLLLDHPMRLSTDIDIIVKPGTHIEDYINRAAEIFPFKSQEEQVRVGKNKIEKRHFKFTYESPITGKDIYILLDVIFEENHYKHLVEKEIKNDLLMIEGENLKVKIPSINCILGDKLTAFAPHTTGILLNTGKDMVVMKQMYDVHTLLNKFDDFDEMISTYNSIIDQEIAYRGTQIDRNDVLDDTYAAALCIASRGKTNWEEYRYYVNGIRSLRSHLFEENYSPEIAARKAAKILYLTTCIKKGVHFHKIEDPLLYKDRNYIGTEMSSLKYFRKVDMEAFAYTIETDLLLNS